MTDILLRACRPQVLLSHLALYGLAAILEAEGAPGVRLMWTAGGNSRPQVTTASANDSAVGDLIAAHATAAQGSWLQRDITLRGKPRGLMSPRLTPFEDNETWKEAQRARHDVLDDLTVTGRWLDLRFLAALGEPCYWRFNRQGQLLQDDGASRLEMQPRNQGSEFVRTRLRTLAAAVAARDASQIMAGLRGEAITDEIGHDALDSRTATGLAGLGPADNALTWCALWGISQFPIAMRTNATAATTGHLGRSRREWFYAPIWTATWRPARLRSILASEPLRIASATGLDLRPEPATEGEVSTARRWLSARDVEGLIRFPIRRFGSDSAPERRAMGGEPVLI